MSLIIKEDMERQISEMWSAINDIPDNAFDKDYAIDQGHFTENKLRENYRKQEQLRNAAPELLEALEQCLSRINSKSKDTWDLKAIYVAKQVIKKATA